MLRLVAALLLALLVLLTARRAAAQRPRLAFDRLAQERGLSNGTVTAVVQDPIGFLWIGTEDGLDRYDGSRFTVYRPVAGDSTSLGDAWVTRLALGRDGALWVSMLGGGVDRYDPATDRFRHYRHVPGNPRSLSSDHANVVYVAGDGAVWVGTVRGLDRLDPVSGRVRHYQRNADSTDVENDVLAIGEDARGRLWVGARRGLFVLERSTGLLVPQMAIATTSPVRALLRDRHGDLWVATENALVALDPAGDRPRVSYRGATPERPSPISGRVLALAESPDGLLWIGSDGGLAALDEARGTFVRHANDRADPRSLGGKIVRSVLMDRGGVLWVGLETYGLSKYAPAAVRFGLIGHDPSSPNALSDGYIRGIVADSSGDLWVGTQFGGLDHLDHRTGRVTVYRHRADDPRSLPGDNVWAVLRDHAGAMWVGLHEQGLGTFDPRTGTFTRSPLVPHDASVNTLVERRDGTLLVGLETIGLYEISPDRKRVRVLAATLGDERVLASNDVEAVLEDREGVLWVGGVDGLTRIASASAGGVTRFHAAPGLPGALSSDFVTNIVQDHLGRIWIATKGGGLDLYDRRTGGFRTLGVGDGLPHSFVYGILEDARGRLWLSTDDGIAVFDPATWAVTRFGLEDGLQAREFNRRAHVRGPDGTMYFGGVNGINVFRPDDAAPAPTAPPVSILALQPADGAPRLLAGQPADSVVTLGSDENAFTITFAALDYTAPEKTRYAYRLEGVNHGWVQARERREASYAGLPPGRYVFRVAAANAAGMWSARAAALTIVVEPAWWATLWARLAAALVVVGLPFLLVRMRVRGIRRRAALLEERVGEQTRDLRAAHARVREGLERERDAARELVDITAAVPGAVFQLHEGADRARAFTFVSLGVVRLWHGEMPAADGGVDDPRRMADRILERVHPDDAELITRALATSRATLEPWRAEVRWIPSGARGGATRWLSMQARPARHADGATVWSGVMVDTTAAREAEAERAALEAKVLQAQKAESLGILAGGIAHDFNNLLVGVLANADLLEFQIPLDDETAETIGHIRTSARRAAELTQQMLAYAGKGRLVVGRVDLAELVREMLALLRSAVPRTIAFDFVSDAPSAAVAGDATQLRQVVMNLVTNASEAIGDRPGRVAVRIRLEHGRQRDLRLLETAPGMPPEGPYVVLEVTDDGCGMDAALLAQIFDPFFTTKFTGRGLGLAALLGIVRTHHGGLHVESAPGQGSTFTIYLPLAVGARPVGGDRGAPPEGAGTAPLPGQEQTMDAGAGTAPVRAGVAAGMPTVMPARRCVLLVEDEEEVLLAMERILSRLGYDVVTATDGTRAVEAVERGAAVDVVLMDVTMPVMDGPTTARALRARGVTAPIVLMSGYAEADLVARGMIADADAFLKKPFQTTQVAAVLRGVIGGQRTVGRGEL